MALAHKTEYFLGANSRYGFRSLYGGFCPADEGCFLHVIKGGPGCGKSSFMRRIGAAAEKEGLDVEYILCSGDPDSIDGVFIPALKVGYVDGTAPHSIDSAYPGCSGMYLDLGRFYDSAALIPERKHIMDLNHRYKALYSAAYASIASAASSLPRCVPDIADNDTREKLGKKAALFAGREFKSRKGTASVSKRFLEALSCKGQIFLSSTISSLCERICLLDNGLGLGHIYLRELLPAALEKGLSVIVCPDCLDPELINALIFPELSLALVCGGPGRDELQPYRHIRLDTLPSRERLADMRPTLRRARKLSCEYMAFAADTLAAAKALHDELETIYNPHVDFDGVYEEAQKHISMLFGT